MSDAVRQNEKQVDCPNYLIYLFENKKLNLSEEFAMEEKLNLTREWDKTFPRSENEVCYDC